MNETGYTSLVTQRTTNALKKPKGAVDKQLRRTDWKYIDSIVSPQEKRASLVDLKHSGQTSNTGELIPMEYRR